MKRFRRFLILLLTAGILLTGSGCSQKPAETALYFYIIGSDLESEGGYASMLLDQLCASAPKEIPILIQVGGARKWNNESVSGTAPQRFFIKNGKLKHLETLDESSMVEQSAVADFLCWAKKQNPGKRCGVIFWDHGGGTAMGFGCDEFHPYDSLMAADFAAAFETAELYPEFIGFDACLMATAEIAKELSNYTDYLIASEDTEPAVGWYYTDWISALDKEPSMPMEELGTKIMEDYAVHAPLEEAVTLSMIRTKEAAKAYDALADFFSDEADNLVDHYPALSSARFRAAEVGENGFDQIDLLSFLNSAGAEEELQQMVRDSVACSYSNRQDTCGLAFYFPVRFPEYYAHVRPYLPTLCEEYDEILSVRAYAGSFGDGPSIPSQLTGYEDDDFSADLTHEKWYSAEVGEKCYHEKEDTLSAGKMQLKEKEGALYLPVTDQQNRLMAASELEVWLENEDDYLFFGRFPTLSQQDGISAKTHCSWPTLSDGQAIPFFTISEDDHELVGYSTATLNNDDDIELVLNWTADDITVKGYRYATEEEEMSFPTRALMQLNPGDTLDFYCPTFSKGGYYNAIEYVGETFTIDDEFHLAPCPIEENNLYAGFRLEDLYGRTIWTQPYLLP